MSWVLPEHHVDALDVAEQRVQHVQHAAVVVAAQRRQQRVAQRQRRHQDLTEPAPRSLIASHSYVPYTVLELH